VAAHWARRELEIDMQIADDRSLPEQIEELNIRMRALCGQVGAAIKLHELRERRDALQAQLDAEIDAAFAAEAGFKGEDGAYAA
jgi:hypothetical protein